MSSLQGEQSCLSVKVLCFYKWFGPGRFRVRFRFRFRKRLASLRVQVG